MCISAFNIQIMTRGIVLEDCSVRFTAGLNTQIHTHTHTLWCGVVRYDVRCAVLCCVSSQNYVLFLQNCRFCLSGHYYYYYRGWSRS